jgi:antitoxin component YwqK of YwqJK toxin-antitoxin module
LTNRYIGQFKDGLKHGIGTFFYADGSKYQGEFRFNLKHGIGIFTKDDGNIEVAKYVEDRATEKISENIDPNFFFHFFSQPQAASPFE